MFKYEWDQKNIDCNCGPVAGSIVCANKIFISPKGNNANEGTQAKPFASIDKALTAAKKKSGSVTVYLLQGTYYLKQPIVFTAKDFGEENKRLLLTNFNNQKVTISGGVPLKLQWKKYKNGIWQASIKQDLIFDELLVNGQLVRLLLNLNFLLQCE
ncbi:DUF1565 domain-containing protein [Terrimonas alba]|uniref:DUF1565 domain-containing protein n=1 Tax=Terrimonas alba TaxID=3349636 RepID=UPI0035F239C7